MLYTPTGSLTNPLLIEAGIQTIVVNAATATGTAASQWFTASEKPGGGDRTLSLSAIPNGAVSALTVDIEVSPDGGTTWIKKHASVALITASVNTQAIEANIEAGMLYRLNITTITGGTSASVAAAIE